MKQVFYREMMEIESAIREVGYDPDLQLMAYVQTQDERYITRNHDARRRIVELDWNLLTEYVNQLKTEIWHP